MNDKHDAVKTPQGVSAENVKKSSFTQTLSAVLWSFFGVRRSDKRTKDMETLNPIHVIIVGLLVAAVFVASLILLVRTVVG